MAISSVTSTTSPSFPSSFDTKIHPTDNETTFPIDNETVSTKKEDPLHTDVKQVKVISPSPSLQQINSTIDQLMEKLDTEIAKKTIDEMAKFDDICALVNQVLALIQSNQKKLTKKLSELQFKAREYHHKLTQEAHSGNSVAILAVTSASFHTIAALAQLSPTTLLKGGEAINSVASRNVFDLARFSNTPEGHASIAQAASAAFGGFAQATGGVQSIAGDRRQGTLQEHSSRSEHAKTDKQEIDQEVSAAGSRTDAAINAAKDHEEKRHRAMQAIAGG